MQNKVKISKAYQKDSANRLFLLDQDQKKYSSMEQKVFNFQISSQKEFMHEPKIQETWNIPPETFIA